MTVLAPGSVARVHTSALSRCAGARATGTSGAGQAKNVAASVVEPEKEVHELGAAVALGQSVEPQVARVETVAEVEPQHERRADRHAQAEPARAEHAPARRRVGPGAPVVDEQRALHARKSGGAEGEPDREEIGDREAELGVEEPG